MSAAAPPSPKRVVRWAAGLLLAGAAASLAATHSVPFSVLVPEAERVYLLGSFNDWKASADALMTNDHGVWRKTLSLEKGEHAYKFKAEGARIAGDGWRLDWKASRENQTPLPSTNSALVLPDDLESFRARQVVARTTDRGIEIPLVYVPCPTNRAFFHPYGHASIPLETNPPAGDWILPACSVEQPLFARIPLGDSQRLAVLDRLPPDALFYNRVHFDRNGNHDLTDDEPLVGTAESIGQGFYYCFIPPFDLNVPVGNRQLPYRLSFQLSGRRPTGKAAATDDTHPLENFNFLVFPNCAYFGEGIIDGAGYRIALADALANAHFGDIVHIETNVPFADRRLFSRGDALYVSTRDRIGPADILQLGQFLALGDRLFEVHLDVLGGTLILAPRSNNLGTLEFPAAIDSMSLLSATDGQALMLRSVGVRAAVPTGTWRLLEYQVSKTDEWGDLWSLCATGTQEAPAVPVPQGITVPLAIGEPLSAVIDVSSGQLQNAGTKRRLEFNLAILGRFGEMVENIQHVSGIQTKHKKSTRRPDRPGEAIYRIIKPDGERIASGSFEYG